MKDQLGIVFGFFARMHPAHASIHAIEAKIQARRSTSIVITRLRQKASRRDHTLVLVLGCDKSRQGITIGM